MYPVPPSIDILYNNNAISKSGNYHWYDLEFIHISPAKYVLIFIKM